MQLIEKRVMTSQSVDAPRHSGYRPDIDGLRAVAVLSVVAFHLRYWWLPGGFVGVDVFFVISGYLISRIIQREIESGSFSFKRFYARRICRIFPAFAVMAIVASLFAYHYLFPTDLVIYARSLISAMLSVSNFYFWETTGYFGVDAATQPLLHTWSLAVEEQFYLLLPMFLIFLQRRFMALRSRAVVLLFLASLGLSCYLVFSHPDAAFYLIPTRAWELLAGTILTFRCFSGTASRLVRETASLAGTGLILLSIFGLSATTPFPGAAAFIPCLGTALIILGGHAGCTAIGTILSTRPVRFVGQISYSMYLWHWPIIVFQRQYAFLVPNEGTLWAGHPYLGRNAAVIAVTLVVSILSWRFIEQPFRLRRRDSPSPWTFVYSTAAIAILSTLAVITAQTGLSRRFSPEELQFASYLDYGQEHFRQGRCFIVQPNLATQFDKGACLARHAERKAYLIIGDSTAADLWYGLSRTLRDVDVLQATGAGCKPFLVQSHGAYAECAKVIDYALRTYIIERQVDTVIISARWGQGDLPQLTETLTWLRKYHLRTVVLGPVIEYTTALPRLLALSVRSPSARLLERERVWRADLDLSLEKVSHSGGASYVSLYGLLCPGGNCVSVLARGVPLQFDMVHLTRQGSEFVARKLVESRVMG